MNKKYLLNYNTNLFFNICIVHKKIFTKAFKKKAQATSILQVAIHTSIMSIHTSKAPSWLL